MMKKRLGSISFTAAYEKETVKFVIVSSGVSGSLLRVENMEDAYKLCYGFRRKFYTNIKISVDGEYLVKLEKR